MAHANRLKKALINLKLAQIGQVSEFICLVNFIKHLSFTMVK